MTRSLFSLFIVVCVLPLAMLGQRATLHTDLPLGAQITLTIEAASEVTLEGVAEHYDPAQSRRTYTLTAQEVVIRGALTRLVATQAQLTSLICERLDQLLTLDCSQNALTQLDLSPLPQLTYLSCYANQLTALDLTANPLLQTIKCTNNQISTLDLSALTQLVELTCSSNQITALNLSYAPQLKTLKCYSNHLKELDITHNPLLENLWCAHNQISEIDLSQCPKLRAIWCYNNQIRTLALPRLSQLLWLHCDNNRLSTLDLTETPKLSRLMCYSNQIRGADMDRLVSSMPNVVANKKGECFIIDTRDANEQNVCTQQQVKTLSERGWQTLDYAGGANEGLGVTYFGSNDSAIAHPLDDVAPLHIRYNNEYLHLTASSPIDDLQIWDTYGVLLLHQSLPLGTEVTLPRPMLSEEVVLLQVNNNLPVLKIQFP